MPFAKHGVAPIAAVKCGCGQTLNSVHSACPTCGKNLRPLSNAMDKDAKRDADADSASDLVLHLAQGCCSNSADD